VRVYTTAFSNFISYHKTITIRISLEGAAFKEDSRLPITPDLEMHSADDNTYTGHCAMRKE